MIIGRSGAGKTTLLRSINRLVEPTAGTVRVAGRAVTGADPAALRQARRQIGMIFQQFNLVRRASVLDNVLAGRLGYVPVARRACWGASRPPTARSPWSAWRRSGSRSWRSGAPTRSPAASSSGWRSPGRWPSRRA